MIVDSMNKQEVMKYIRKEYNSTIISHFHNHLKLYRTKIYPICERGKQKKVSLPWETVQSKDRTKFHLQVFGDKDNIDTLTVAEFDWQSQHCFAYIKHKLMIIFCSLGDRHMGHTLIPVSVAIYNKKQNV